MFILLLLYCLFSTMAGCSLSSYRVHPEWTSAQKNLRALLIAQADVKIYQVLPGMNPELRRDWSKRAVRNLDKAILHLLEKKNYRVQPLKAERKIKKEMTQIFPLFRAVDKSIRLHTYGPQIYPDKKDRFEYSIGPLKGILDTFQCDAMVFVRGFGLMAEAPGKTYISLALADSAGNILWYCVRGSKGDFDLRDSFSTESLVDTLLSEFPEAAW